MADTRDEGPSDAGGYSLLELLLATAIIALLALSGTGLYDLLHRERKSLAVLELRRYLNFARGTAVNLQQRVTLCALDERGYCRRDWQGRTIAIFLDGNRNRRLDDGEALRMGHWSEGGGPLHWRASLRRRYIEFKPGGNTAQNGSFLFCPEGAHGRASAVVVVNRAGRNYVAENSRRRCP